LSAFCATNGLESRVAGRVAVLLVDRAKAVDVAHDHGDRAAAAGGAVELHLEQLLEGAAVEQPGQRVGAARAGDARAQGADARALVQHEAGQHERADGG
jgi:hypothetical protein